MNTLYNTYRRGHIVILLLLTSYAVIGQQSDALRIIPHYEDNSVKLRWVPMTSDVWLEGNDSGYTIQRITMVSQGDTLNDAGIESSLVDLDTGLQPLSDAQWGIRFTDNDYAKIARQTIHMIEDTPSTATDASLLDALMQDQNRNDRFQFGLVASFMDFEVAEGMALAIEDATVESNSTYIYRIVMTDGPEAFVVVATDEETSYPEIYALNAEQQDTSVLVSWSTAFLDETYVAYNIERKGLDDTEFVQLNELPFVIFYQDEEGIDDTYAQYSDSSGVIGVTYEYRVRGVTPFATVGPPSDSDTVTVMPQALPIQIVLEGELNDAEQVELNWTIFGEVSTRSGLGIGPSFGGLVSGEIDINDAASGYNILRMGPMDSTFVHINESLITERSYIDTEPLSEAEYMIQYTDEMGMVYNSFTKLVMGVDETPPAIPSGLNVRNATSRTLEFTWEDNDEWDLAGYNIYSNVAGDDNYFAINSSVIESAVYTYNVPVDMDHESLCFKIVSIDFRGNQSEMSECVIGEFEDVTPPSTPIITKIEAQTDGVALGWKLSSSEDVTMHYLERRWTGFIEWDRILEIAPGAEGDYPELRRSGEFIMSNYVDATHTTAVSHDYRLVAIDSSDNKSYTPIVSATPISVMTAGVINGFSVALDSIVPVTLPQQEQLAVINYAIEALNNGQTADYDTLNPLIVFMIMTNEELESIRTLEPKAAALALTEIRDRYWSSSIPTIQLSWQYDGGVQLEHYEVYRSTGGADFVLYDTPLPDADAIAQGYIDEGIDERYFYLYKIRGVHSGGVYSEFSPTLILDLTK